MRLSSRVAASSTRRSAAAAAFLTGNCGSGRALGSGDVENAGPAYTSAAGLAAFLPWCLRPGAVAGGDLLPATAGLLLLLGRRCDAAGRVRCGAGRRMLCARSTSVAMSLGRRIGGELRGRGKGGGGG